MSEWISSFEATVRLRQAGVVHPFNTLTQLAEARYIRARAKWGRFSDDDGEDREFLNEPPVDENERLTRGPWPDVPSDFWRWVNLGGDGSEAHFEAGTFAAVIRYDHRVGSHSDKQHIKLFGVTFHSQDMDDFLKGRATLKASPLMPRQNHSNVGRPINAERWGQYGAAMALEAHLSDKKTVAKSSSFREAVESRLVSAGYVPMDEKTVREMFRLAVLWIDAEEVVPPAE